MADLAKLVVRLEAQSAQMIAELDKANSKIDRFASNTNKTLNKWAGGLLTIFSGKAILAWTKSVVDAEDKLNDMAQKAGESVETVSKLGYAASQSGSDIDSLAVGLKGLSNTAADAAKGSKTAVDAFAAIGVKVTDSNGKLKSSSDLLLEVAEQFSQYEDGVGKAAAAQDIFKKAGLDLIPFLNQGAAGIKQLTDEADRLGITVSTKSARAADEFNDSLDKLQKTAAGLTGGALTQGLVRITEAFNLLAENAAGVQDFSRQIETGFKIVIDIGYSVYKTLDNIGTALGALGAAAVEFAKGNFSQARDIIRLANEDQIKSEKEANDFIERLWNDRALDVRKSASDAADGVEAADARVKKTFIYGGASRVEEVKITGAEKFEESPMAKFYDDLDKRTQTSSERSLTAYYEQRAAIQALYDDGKISLQQYNDRIDESVDELLPKVEITAKRVTEINLDAFDKLTEYEKQAARNTQDIIADALESGFDEGADGLLKSFGEMLKKLALQAAAADIAGYLFGSAGGGKGKGFVGTALSAIGTYFGGTMDSGGRGRPGVEYSIGTGAQPERFVPDTPGTFIPANSGGAALTVNNSFFLPSNEPPSRRAQEQIAASGFRGAARANRRNN